MEEVGRLRWVAETSFTCNGARIHVRCNQAAVWNQVIGRLPPHSVVSRPHTAGQLFSLWVAPRRSRSQVRDAHVLYAGSSVVALTNQLKEALDHLESALHFAVATAGEHLFIHAGVVGWNGRSIIIPGRSLSGKTTLVEALVRKGATYYSDEYAILNRAGRVLPYPKPLSIRQTGQAPRRLRGEELGLVGTKSLPVGWVVITRYRAGTRWSPRLLSPADSMLALLDNTVMARYRSELAMTTLRRAVAGAAGVSSRRDSAQEAAKWLLAAAPWTLQKTRSA